MVYLDYSATTPVDKRVLESFDKATIEYNGNANSLHVEGLKAKELMESAVNQVATLLKVKQDEIIFTSGASEANNLAIKGIVENSSGKTIITTKLEHSSILSCVDFLEKKGYIIKYVNIKDNGQIDLDQLEELIDNDTVLVSICEVNSEIGIIQNVDEIGKILKKYPRVVFHVDGTQAVGKKQINLENIDLYSFSAHKIYGLKGIGCLVKKENINLVPLIHGGKSQTVYRAGTPPVALMVSLAKALRLVLMDLDNNIKYVEELRKKLISGLKKIDSVIINSNDYCVPHIINFSVLNIKPETLLHSLEEDEIYLSTKTACSSSEDLSLSVLELTKDEEKAKSSLRISLSVLTKYNEIDYFLEKLKEKIERLKSIGN